MTEEFIKECDDIMLDLINKGLVEAIKMENGEVGFRLSY